MLFLLTFACAVILGVTMKRLRDRKAALSAIRAADGTMGMQEGGPEWLRQLIQDDECFLDPLRVSLGPIARQAGRVMPSLDDARLEKLSGALKNFDHLEVLDIRRTAITDRSAQLLSELPNIKHLRLADTQISDTTVHRISYLRRLESLDLSGTGVTDECVDDLCKLSSLTYLDVGHTKITSNGVARLQQQLVRCKISN
jgi:hypothetical protein